MLKKLAIMRSNAPYELPKAKVCAYVVGTLLSGGSDQEISQSIKLLKAVAGQNWSSTQALQYLSGQQAELAIDCAPEGERVALYAIHLVAKTGCNEAGISGSAKADGIDLAKLRAMASNVQS